MRILRLLDHPLCTCVNALTLNVAVACRGPLLEAAVDLEQRLHHILTSTGEWANRSRVSEEEVIYTLFTIAQVCLCWLALLHAGCLHGSTAQCADSQS